MILYHCSPTPGLRTLEPRVTPYFDKPCQLCLTELRPMALFYGIRHFEYPYGYTRAGELYYLEQFPGMLAELYGGKSASLYLCGEREGMERTAIPHEVVTRSGWTRLTAAGSSTPSAGRSWTEAFWTGRRNPWPATSGRSTRKAGRGPGRNGRDRPPPDITRSETYESAQ